MQSSSLLTYGRLVIAAFAGSVALCAGVTAAMAVYALPNGDEFCLPTYWPMYISPAWQPAQDAFTYAADSWRFITGRWLTILWLSLILQAHIPYPLLIGAAWLTILLGLYLLARLLVRGAGRASGLAIAGGLWALLWYGLPGVGDGFYWFTGVVQNLVPFTFAVLAVRGLVHGTRGQTVGAIVAAIIVASLHELQGVYLVAILSAGAFLLWRTGDRAWRRWLVCAACAALAVAVVVVAPGNFARASMNQARDIARGLGGAVEILTDAGIGWLVSLPLWAGTLAFLLHPRVRALHPSWVERLFPGWWKALIPLVTGLLVLVGTTIPSVARSGPAQGRTINGVYLVLLVGWLVTAFVVSRRWSATIGPSPSLGAIALLVFSVSVLVDGNTRVAFTDLRGRVRPWHAAMEARRHALEAASGKALVVSVDRPPPIPRLFLAADVTDNRDNFRNRCVAAYYDVEAVVLPADDPAAR